MRVCQPELTSVDRETPRALKPSMASPRRFKRESHQNCRKRFTFRPREGALSRRFTDWVCGTCSKDWVNQFTLRPFRDTKVVAVIPKQEKGAQCRTRAARLAHLSNQENLTDIIKGRPKVTLR